MIGIEVIAADSAIFKNTIDSNITFGILTRNYQDYVIYF